MAYWNPILVRSLASKLDRVKHLNGVTKTIIPDAQLDALCVKFNFVKDQVLFRLSRDTIVDHFKSLGIGTTDALIAKINAPVANPKAPIPPGAMADQVKGPMALPHLIDWMWTLLIEPVPPNLIKPFTKMFDPDAEEGPTGAMMSHVKHGFRTYGIAFRGDTRSYAEFSPRGFTARFSEPPGHPFHVPGAHETLAARGMAFDRSARDFANQTGVCVARNIVGSMKFVGARRDEDDEVTSTSGYIYAIKFAQGCDTEQMQRDRALAVNNTKVLWRAGEKAAWQIPKYQFIASCKFEVDKPYSSQSGVTTFQFRRLTEWTFHQTGRPGWKEYIQQATAKFPLNTWCNFGATDDWAKESNPDQNKPSLV